MTLSDKFLAGGLTVFGALCAFLLGPTTAAVACGTIALIWFLVRWQAAPETQRRLAAQVFGFHRFDDEQIVTRRSLGLRVFSGSVALFFAAGAVFTLCFWNAPYALGWPVKVMEVGVLTALTLLLWRGAGPHDVQMDLYRGAYRMTSGFPLLPALRHGTLNEVGVVCVRSDVRSDSKTPPSFWVTLIWKQPRRRDVFLCRCGSQEAADAVARRVTDALGLPDGDSALGALWFRNARLRRCDEGALAFHKSLALRITMGVLGKALTVGCLILSGLVVVGKGGLHLQPATTNQSWLLLDVLGLLCLRAAGPQDLEFDLAARTYLYRAGFPGLARTVTGSLDDVVALKTDAAGDTGGFRVRLLWAHPRRREVTLGEFTSRQEADAHRHFLETRLFGPDY